MSVFYLNDSDTPFYAMFFFFFLPIKILDKSLDRSLTSYGFFFTYCDMLIGDYSLQLATKLFVGGIEHVLDRIQPLGLSWEKYIFHTFPVSP